MRRSAKRARPLLAVTIPERPGAFRAFCAALGRRVVTEFNYRLAARDAAHIFVGLRTASRRRRAASSTDCFGPRATPPLDLTDNELAKLHVRHMVGGRAPDVARRARSAASSSPNGPAR